MEVIHGAGRIAAAGAGMSIDDYNLFSQKDRHRMHGPFFPLFQEVLVTVVVCSACSGG